MPSTAIRFFRYEAKTRRLTIMFVTGRLYIYDQVPERVAEEFRRAPSKGAYFNAHIRGHYRFNEVFPGAA